MVPRYLSRWVITILWNESTCTQSSFSKYKTVMHLCLCYPRSITSTKSLFQGASPPTAENSWKNQTVCKRRICSKTSFSLTSQQGVLLHLIVAGCVRTLATLRLNPIPTVKNRLNKIQGHRSACNDVVIIIHRESCRKQRRVNHRCSEFFRTRITTITESWTRFKFKTSLKPSRNKKR